MSHQVTFQFYRGPSASFPPAVVADGEPVWVTNTHALFVAQGGVLYPIGGSAGGVISPVAEEMVYYNDSLVISQTSHIRYKDNRMYFLNVGPPTLADLRPEEFTTYFEMATP